MCLKYPRFIHNPILMNLYIIYIIFNNNDPLKVTLIVFAMPVEFKPIILLSFFLPFLTPHAFAGSYTCLLELEQLYLSSLVLVAWVL